MKKTIMLTLCMAVALSVQADFEGMGYEVARQIRERAKEEWPNDYSMQEFEIKRQREGWKSLHTYRHHRVPDKILKDLRDKARMEWPGDYAMQWWEFTRQIDAYLRLADAAAAD
jgi:hypothetical protein